MPQAEIKPVPSKACWRLNTDQELVEAPPVLGAPEDKRPEAAGHTKAGGGAPAMEAGGGWGL